MNSPWSKSKLVRLLYWLLAAASVLFLPWWLSGAFVLLGIILINQFYELALVGLLFDLCYGAPAAGSLVKTPVALGTIALVYLFSLLKNYVSFFR